jgi:hypothetical protein
MKTTARLPGGHHNPKRARDDYRRIIAAMDELKVRKDGLLIPSDRLGGFGRRASIARSRDVLIIESLRRVVARGRLAEQVRRLRLAARSLDTPTRREIVAEVSAARARRARRR